MEYNKHFFEKVFSNKRMERYFALYPNDESICWNMHRVQEIHNELLLLLGWINKDLPILLQNIDRFDDVQARIKEEMGVLS